MPKRTSVRKVLSEKVQGEGSYVILRDLKVKDIRKLREMSKDENFDAFEGGIDLLRGHILGWNWVDDTGQPLPQPKDDPSVIDELTNAESEFLSGLLSSTDEAKNLKDESLPTSG